MCTQYKLLRLTYILTRILICNSNFLFIFNNIFCSQDLLTSAILKINYVLKTFNYRRTIMLSAYYNVHSSVYINKMVFVWTEFIPLYSFLYFNLMYYKSKDTKLSLLPPFLDISNFWRLATYQWPLHWIRVHINQNMFRNFTRFAESSITTYFWVANHSLVTCAANYIKLINNRP